MNWKQLHTTTGVRDYYGDELDRKISLERGLLAAIRDEGFERFETPSLEYFDVFSNRNGTVSSKNLFKVDDREGNTMVLRPDLTPSVARCAVMYFNDDEFPLRICYKGNTFVNQLGYRGQLSETTQIGAELMGDAEGADAEILGVAVKALKVNGAESFKINIGHAAFLGAIMDDADISPRNYHEFYEYVACKNFSALAGRFRELGVASGLVDIAANLDVAYSDSSALKDAAQNARSYPAVKAVFDELLALAEDLEKIGISEYVCYDLGFIGRYDYYTGIVFAGYMPLSGTTVIKGGRYDRLLSSFGKNKPAVGFVIDVNLLLTAMEDTEAKSSKEGYLTVALGKGRLAKSAMKLLGRIGVACDEMDDESTRKLIFVNEEDKTRFFLAKAPDVPTYVEYGAADIGIVGADTIIEEGREAYEVLDLGFGKCRMCVCGPDSARDILESRGRIRVATKYPRIARDYFYNTRHQNVEIIKLNGSIELAPLVGLSDVIVDIVETGSTLRENGLVILEEIMPLSARLIVNKASMETEHDRIVQLIRDLDKTLSQQ